MSRLIDADALEKKLHELALDEWNQGVSTSWSNAYLECEDMVYNAQTIEPKHGHWIEEIGMFLCSECGDSWGTEMEEMVRSFNYCPNCGAKMGEVTE